MEYKFNHAEEPTRGSFEITEDGTRLAHMTYSRIDHHHITIDHTIVEPIAKGRGLGKLVVQKGVEWARAHDQKITPLCTFAKAIMEKDPQTHDVLHG